MKHYLLFTALLLFSCGPKKEIRYSGFDDFFVRSYQISLYENGEFKLILGAGATEGKYTLSGDTVILFYNSKPEKWPDRFLMTNTHFVEIKADTANIIRITRTK